jgi:hypothetical protein
LKKGFPIEILLRMNSTRYLLANSPLDEDALDSLPPSFFQKLEFEEPRRRYQTEQFPLTDPFPMYSQRELRVRASSLSIPQKSVSEAFGTPVFASAWEPSMQTTEVDDPTDINALARTIDYLGLDDPYGSPAQDNFDRLRSLSYPLAEDFTRQRSATTIDLEADTSKIPSWDEMVILINKAEKYKQAVSVVTSSEQSYDSPQLMVPSRSLWIGNIDSNFSSEELLSIFGKFGEIESIRMLPEKECAFVNFQNLEDALDAREKMQGGRIGNCIIRIGFGKTDAINDSQGMQPTKSLWVGNIPPSTKPCDLEAMFAKYGPVESARVLVYFN